MRRRLAAAIALLAATATGGSALAATRSPIVHAATRSPIVHAATRSPIVHAGPARFEVLTPTLIRLEYAEDRRFEDGQTMTATRSPLPVAPFTVSRVRGWLAIRTGLVTLRYRLGSGPFNARNLALALLVGRRRRIVHPVAGSSYGNLGGWRRALDLLSAPVALNDGLLSTAGWYVLDDTATVRLTPRAPGFAVRGAHRGPYRDWYLFAYGHDYARGLADLRALTGPAPLPPRTAFGAWFSRYWPYSEADYHGLLAQFRAAGVPVDTLSLDTDFKRESDPAGAALAAIVAGAPGKPYSWNGWEWDRKLFPVPSRFLTWAHRAGLSVTVNIHPSISSHDPQWPATESRSGGLGTSNGTCRILIADATASCGVFDWTSPRQLDAYFALHRTFEHDGVDFFWLDWCCDASSAGAPGLSADTWINSRYAVAERARGLRWPAFGRVGGRYDGSLPNDGDATTGGAGIFAEHRYTIQFTGDTCATWSMLAFEAQFTAQEGNAGLPYVSHDIGSFNGAPRAGQCSAQTGLFGEHLADDIYARWVALGTFQPLDRLHSNHGDRLPWQYGAAADSAATAFLRLREALNPYTYTLARRAYDTGLPIDAAPYLEWPDAGGAYRHPSEFMFGPDIVVSPVTAAGDPAPATVWVPPGRWVDYFTGRLFGGPAVARLSVPLSRMPVLVRAGAVVVTQPYAPFTAPGPSRTLIVTAYPAGTGRFVLYDDPGVGFGYIRGAFTRTTLDHTGSAVTIGPAVGSFPGAPRSRSWTVRFVRVRRPRSVLVDSLPATSWSYSAGDRVLTVRTDLRRTDRPVTVSFR